MRTDSAPHPVYEDIPASLHECLLDPCAEVGSADLARGRAAITAESNSYESRPLHDVAITIRRVSDPIRSPWPRRHPVGRVRVEPCPSHRGAAGNWVPASP